MKKLVAVLTGLMLFGMLFAEPVKSTSGNKLGTLGNVTVSADMDYSKRKPLKLSKAVVEEVNFQDETCVKVTKNNMGEIRLSFMFDEPVPVGKLKKISYSIAGFEGYKGHYNIGVMYEDMDKGTGEHVISCYSSDYILKDEWTDWKFDLLKEELWHHNFNADRKIIGIQLWTNSAKQVYITNVELSEK